MIKLYDMRHYFNLLITLVICIALGYYAPKVFGQDVQLRVATGGTSGTYHQMFTELNQKCSDSMSLIEQTSNGSLDNIALLLGNKVNAAIVQEDILFLKKRSEPALLGFKTLFTLHPEEVHIVALSAGKKEGGVLGFGGNIVTLNSITDLAGKKVGSFGGSMVTAQVVKLQSDIPFQIFDVGNAGNGLKALESGEIDAILAVGGYPLGWLEQLGPQVKLLDVPESVANKLKDVYQKATVSYPRMNASGIPTLATSAIFVSREYKTEKYVKALSQLRGCLFKNLDELKETTGLHPKWSAVNSENKGTWVWYELPAQGGIENSGSKMKRTR